MSRLASIQRKHVCIIYAWIVHRLIVYHELAQPQKRRKIWKVLNLGKVSWHNLLEQFFLTYQRLILLYYFHQKISKGKTAIFKSCKLVLWLNVFSSRRKSDICISRLYFCSAGSDHHVLSAALRMSLRTKK